MSLHDSPIPQPEWRTRRSRLDAKERLQFNLFCWNSSLCHEPFTTMEAESVHHDRLAQVDLSSLGRHEPFTMMEEESVHHGRLTTADSRTSLSSVESIGSHELFAVSEEDSTHHGRLTAADDLARDSPLVFSDEDEGKQEEDAEHEFWLTEEEVQRELDNSARPWRKYVNRQFSTDGIDCRHGTEDFLHEAFAKSVFFAMSKCKRLETKRLEEKWNNFTFNVEYKLNNLDEAEKRFKDSEAGFTYKVHHMCLTEKIPRAAGAKCIACTPLSNKLPSSAFRRPEYQQLSQELRELIALVSRPMCRFARELKEKEKELKQIEERPVVQFVVEHVNGVCQDLHARMDEFEEVLTVNADFEMDVSIIRDDLENLQERLEAQCVDMTEMIEKSVDVAVASAFDDASDTSYEEHRHLVNEMKTVSRKVNKIETDIAGIKLLLVQLTRGRKRKQRRNGRPTLKMGRRNSM